MSKPTIHDLEKILSEPSPTIRILPDGSVTCDPIDAPLTERDCQQWLQRLQATSPKEHTHLSYYCEGKTGEKSLGKSERALWASLAEAFRAMA